MFNFDLTENNNFKAISIYINLRLFPDSDDTSILDLTPAQLKFIKTQNISDYYDDTMTTLFYRFGSIRTKNFIVKSVASILARGITSQSIIIEKEGVVGNYHSHNFDLHRYKTISPIASVTTMSSANSAWLEHIGVHVDHTFHGRWLQYNYTNNNAYGLAKRLERLCNISTKFTVSNKSLRQYIYT